MPLKLRRARKRLGGDPHFQGGISDLGDPPNFMTRATGTAGVISYNVRYRITSPGRKYYIPPDVSR